MKKQDDSMTRRDFIKSTSVATAATAASKAHAVTHGRPAIRARRLVRMGVVGGGFGRSFFWHIHPNSKVTAVCDLRDDRLELLQARYECDVAYKDFHDLIADKNVDAVAVFTPAPLHTYMAVEAMKAGKHVISAVPAGNSLDECRQLIDTVKKTGMLYMMAETSFYRDEIIACRDFAREGKFGTIMYSEAEYHHEGLVKLMFDERGFPTWRHGLPPMFYPTHCTGMIIPVTGERLVEVSAIGWGDRHEVLRTNIYNNPFWNTTAFFLLIYPISFSRAFSQTSRISVMFKFINTELLSDILHQALLGTGGISITINFIILTSWIVIVIPIIKVFKWK